MLKLNPEFLRKKGKPEFVVLTYREWRDVLEALEDAKDVADLRAARRENAGKRGVPIDELKRRLGIGRGSVRRSA